MKSFSRGKGRILFIVSLVLILFLLSFIAIAEPPSLKNQQFYGKVVWKATQNTPLKVIVKSGTQTWESTILRPSCTAQGNCEGSYGEDTSNILRVQPAAASLAFYIDTISVKSETYQPYKVTKVDLDISSSAPLPAPSTPQTQLPATTSPTTPTTPTASTTTPTTPRTTTLVTKTACEYKWDCTQWSVCTNGMTTRSCSRTDTCD
ncbi:hypothetical protein HYU21_03210, partial [Candidatus Woesearchaeota archaeon]|nr:hypothetical protein [Candidatus Woesearchaeota archaeon]